MPELPDIVAYIEALERATLGRPLVRIRLASPFLLRTVEPSLAAFHGRSLRSLSRIGKRIVFGFDEELFLILHLMIAGRLHWRPPAAPLSRRLGLAAFDFPAGTLLLTEAGSKKRASLHAARGRESLRDHDRGGIEPLDCSLADFGTALARENHTVKRALTDPRLFSGIGNWCSDEILHRAHLSPVRLTRSMTTAEIAGLHAATRQILGLWIERLRAQAGDGFPEKVTAFRPDMAVHGKFGQPCPVCAAPVQRIRHADNETNCCPRCQTGGRILADRALSRLLKADWPRTLEELEERQASRANSAAGQQGA